MQGYIYPNEFELHWSILVVVYPYVTGLVAGAFILASLERVFNVKEVQPTYRLALLTALAFLLVAPLPLLAHLGHPLRSYEIFLTPNRQSAMAMFGFVYAWYLMVVLLLEIWFDYRKDLVLWARQEKGLTRWIHYALTLGATDLSPRALSFDERMGRWITIIGIPSAFLLHGYVGFIFGSVKANPWWSSVLMPVVFLFSAIVSGIALVLIIYMVSAMLRWKPVDMKCVDKLAAFLFYAMVVDFSLEMLDFIHRLYESEESIEILSQMIESRLFISLIVLQVALGTLLPMITLGLTAPALSKRSAVKLPDELKRLIYLGSAILVQIGIFSIRWNVVIGGQLFSKSLRGLTVYKLELFGVEGLLAAAALLILPFVILWVLVKILPPWPEAEAKLPRAEDDSGAVTGAVPLR
ncbi:MAG: polysulfide reductase [Gemmatimonadetes bacterium]|uniref:Polysulfide reductase n=1 Tax=Candidatus Kutchimonas denitrificans TaxID=3056748 RepID=A0AAE5CDM9_9BACT|nr:polysulfide reductase [Gemmatimonadota bacterium]NIR76109.1 polysulfide reductase [Candidatus Kutchimonas denitrificans]NIS00488.1 polysulfide reductase [Gemmatimonadota bacterium]NIT66146.1 polysulfide reductase [Gemmatimonadota bacterium]NIU54224.1 polysulfide reductase [Gemmatimonadota bacterium]